MFRTLIDVHLVVNPEILGKIRRLLNQAAKFQDASLNQSLCTGPDLLVLPSLRFLWWENPTTDVVLYQNTHHIFGVEDLIIYANNALQRTAKFYFEAAKTTTGNFYTDDYLDSVEFQENAINRSKESVHLLLFRGFKLTKFVSN